MSRQLELSCLREHRATPRDRALQLQPQLPLRLPTFPTRDIDTYRVFVIERRLGRKDANHIGEAARGQQANLRVLVRKESVGRQAHGALVELLSSLDVLLALLQELQEFLHSCSVIERRLALVRAQRFGVAALRVAAA
mgnify:CR=1 FL=1